MDVEERVRENGTNYRGAAIALIVIAAVILVAVIIFLIVWFTWPQSIQSSNANIQVQNGIMFQVTNQNNAFSYYDKSSGQKTVYVPIGIYNGTNLANILKSLLRRYNSTWNVNYNVHDYTFSISTADIQWARCNLPQKTMIYSLMGFSTNVQCGNTTQWQTFETGNPT